ncbi:MAG: hypothetical protein WDM77_11015 [Steroidobacteraceae bacterium]
MIPRQALTQTRGMPEVEVICGPQRPQAHQRAAHLCGLARQHQHALALGLEIVGVHPIDHGGRLLSQPRGERRFGEQPQGARRDFCPVNNSSELIRPPDRFD